MCSALGCAPQLPLGSDLLWTADTETADLAQWTGGAEELVLLPSSETRVEVTSELSRSGRHAVELINPGGSNEEAGPELLHPAGAEPDAYYSAWLLLPEDYRVEPDLTLVHLRSRDDAGELRNGEQLRLRSLPSGGFVLFVFHNNASFLQEPLADPPPIVQAGRWFHVETRYQPRDGGRLMVWLDGQLYYDLSGRPGSGGREVVLSVGTALEQTEPSPLRLLVDDAAISVSRVTPAGHLALD